MQRRSPLHPAHDTQPGGRERASSLEEGLFGDVHLVLGVSGSHYCLGQLWPQSILSLQASGSRSIPTLPGLQVEGKVNWLRVEGAAVPWLLVPHHSVKAPP